MIDSTSKFVCKYSGKKFSVRRPFDLPNSEHSLNISCVLQGVGSTIKWKARLANYKSHIKKENKGALQNVQPFMNTCVDPDIPRKYLKGISHRKTLSSDERA